jgi:4-hydroxyproline epimerase
MNIRVIDSHTGGEPTRVIVQGGPDLGVGSLFDRRTRFRNSFDAFRSAVVNEPRGSDALVGALLCAPEDPSCSAGVIFFNNVGYLGMCGHGAIGVIATLAYLRRIEPGLHRLETPVGVVTAELHTGGNVTVRNVASYRHRKNTTVQVSGVGAVTGDVAWGGNWFFLTETTPYELNLKNLDGLIDYAWHVRQSLWQQDITGTDMKEIDHIEISGPPQQPGADSRNFVLCPGKAYDRSPCGTGTSAKLACLYLDGQLEPGTIWRQEGILGSIFEGRVELVGEQIFPLITGTAFVTADSQLVFEDRDPFRWGIRPLL